MKYYIPAIEEFHVGFEYEVQQLDEVYGEITDNDKYSSFLFHEDDSLKDIKDLISKRKIRVKYLDEEDILSLLFVKDGRIEKGINLYKIHRPKMQFTDRSQDYFHLRYEPDIHRVLITEGNYNHYRFIGIINNKSELKRIIKQIQL